MKLRFLGTRGYIKARTERHYMHASLLVSYRGTDLMLDCGEDWLEKIGGMNPGAIFITHAQSDHAWGLKKGAPCPVYGTEETWQNIGNFDIAQDRRVLIEKRKPIDFHGMTVEAFPVEHSTRAEAVGYRISASGATIFYVPDVVYIHDRNEALSGVQLYVGDGATIVRSMVRKPGEKLIGHTPIRTQLTWCQKEGVPRAVFSHCGSEIVEGDERIVEDKVRELARQRGIEAQIAYDGMEVEVRT